MANARTSNYLIILATYMPNKHFLSQQIRSIALQADCPSFSLIIRDDWSQGKTTDLLQQLAQQYPATTLICDDRGRLGAKGNFSELLRIAYQQQSDYILFSDQDDVWMEDKISRQSALMHSLEQANGGMPTLVYSDMVVVDQYLQTIAPSFMTYQGIRHEPQDAARVLLTQNFVTGCAAMANRALVEIAYPIPEEAILHDWWFALCAAVFGEIGYIDRPLVKYRQHDHNVVGAKHLSDYLNPLNGQWKKRWLEGRDNLFQSMKQADALAERIQHYDPDNPHLPLVEAYAELASLSPWRRVVQLQKIGVHAQSLPRQALLLSRLLLDGKS